MLIIAPPNGSFPKIIITLFYISSFLCLVGYFIKNRNNIITAFVSIKFIFLGLIILGVINLIRGFEFNSKILITLFGNRDTGFAMLLPLSAILGYRMINIYWYNRLCILICKFGILFSIGSIFDSFFRNLAIYTLLFSIMPLALISYQNRLNRLIIIISTIILIILEILNGGRLPALQIIFIYAGIFMIYIFKKIKSKLLIRVVVMLIIILPASILYSGINIFQYFSNYNSTALKQIDKHDTRTFLYTEVLEDLNKTNSLISGKGAMGKYYSAYFAQGVENGDFDTRINVEVGILSMLLKGGVINAVLNLLLVIISIVLSFKSENIFLQKLSIITLCHLLSLFVSDIPQYTIYSLTIWIAIGASVSQKIRVIPDNLIEQLFSKKIKLG